MVKKLLGDAVREERLRRNLSQNSLAEQAKISLRTVSDIENYIGNPQLETLYALATYLHISIDAIFSNQKTNPDSTMQQIMAELNSCPEEQKQLALSTLRGLDKIDRRILQTMIVNFQGGPVGLETLAAAIGEDSPAHRGNRTAPWPWLR